MAEDVVNLRHPQVWGPKFWAMYDIVVQTYPRHPTSDERRAARAFFKSQRYLIPCGTCKRNYARIIRRFPPAVNSRVDLMKWLDHVKTEVAKHASR